MAGFLGFFNYEKPGKGIAENAPERKGLFLCRYETKQQKQCLKELEKMNASLKSGDHHETL